MLLSPRAGPVALIGLAVQALMAAASPGKEHHLEETTAYHTQTIEVVISRTVTVLCTTTQTVTDWTAVTNTQTDFTAVTQTQTSWTEVVNTNTAWVEVTSTQTETTTSTKSETTTTTQTETSITTQTDTSTTTTTSTIETYSLVQNPCPTSCSMSVPSVTVFFWPTDRPYSYPSTYVEPNFGYTFSSPSVYMYIPTAVGTAPGNRTVGPETTAWMLPLRLHQVSTIAPDGTLTRQLNLADLRTDCPHTAAPEAIATLGPECNPVLAAPPQFSSWAWPCGACGRMGLFDPPYAIPTVTGSLVPPPTSAEVTTTAPPPPVTTPPPATTNPPAGGPTGTLLVVYTAGSQAVATATVLVPGQSGTSTSYVGVTNTGSGLCFPTGTTSTSSRVGQSTGSSSTSAPPTAGAGPRATGGAAAVWGGIGAAVVAALV